MANRRLSFLWVVTIACGSCASPPVDRAQWEQAAKRLLQPLIADADVGCGELRIEISPNYYVNVSQPAVDPNLHGMRKEHVDGCDETVWVNKVGDLSGAFTLTIGATDEFTEKGIVRGRATRFTVLHEVRLRVHTAGEVAARLDVTATGKPLVWNTGGQLHDLTEFRVSGGLLVAR